MLRRCVSITASLKLKATFLKFLIKYDCDLQVFWLMSSDNPIPSFS